MVKVVTALNRELAGMPAVKESALAASALALARMLDDPKTADTARSAAARELREALAVLHGIGADDGVDRMTQYEAGLRVAS